MSFSIKSIDRKQIYLNRKGSMVLEQNKEQYDKVWLCETKLMLSQFSPFSVKMLN